MAKRIKILGVGKPRPPTEHEIQTELCDWLDATYPDILYYAIPNAGKRGPKTAGRMLAEGLKKGVPDLCICAARAMWHGMYIEMKRMTKSPVSSEQKWWINELRWNGYHAVIACGLEEAKKKLLTIYNEFCNYGLFWIMLNTRGLK